jgi:hypothetical protein
MDMNYTSGGGDKGDDAPKKSPIGSHGGSVDEEKCPLCDAVHRPVFSLRKADEPRVDRYAPICPKSYNGPAMFTMCSLAGKVASADLCCQEIAEHAVRFMLTQGAHWVHTDQNQRALVSASTTSGPDTAVEPEITKKGSSSKKEKEIVIKKEITEMPATSIALIKSSASVEKLTVEPLMMYFHKHLMGDKPWRAGINALVSVSQDNLKNLRNLARKSKWATDGTDRRLALFQLLMSFDLSLTHYADSARGQRVPSKDGKNPNCVLSLYSRLLLDRHAPNLGIKGYPTGNTPSMAFKNVGHVDYVFFAIEPRTAGPMTGPFKVGSRFGSHCHMIDFAALPFFSIMTLGDLDTCNAKIGENRLTFGSHPDTAAALGFGEKNVLRLKDSCESLVTNPKAEEGKSSTAAKGKTIYLRRFRTMSEQIFLRDHIKEALALKVLIDCAEYGFLQYGYCDANPTAADYNVLINGLFVPQIMIPHAFCTDQALIFEGKKLDS